jgi:6-pyruvoyl tetrahydropterin synthase/QueD family protein
MMGFKVVVDKGNLRFDCAHFITFGGKCEHLHGHNYGVSVTVEGPLTADSYVVDFVDLKKIVRRVSETLDHRFLLPLKNPHLLTEQKNEHWSISFEGRQYQFPARDVVPLPVDNITAERLAQYIWNEIVRELLALGNDHLATITVGIEEAPGQSAYFSQELTAYVPEG